MELLDFRPGLVGGCCTGVDPCYLAERATQAIPLVQIPLQSAGTLGRPTRRSLPQRGEAIALACNLYVMLDEVRVRAFLCPGAHFRSLPSVTLSFIDHTGRRLELVRSIGVSTTGALEHVGVLWWLNKRTWTQSPPRHTNQARGAKRRPSDHVLVRT